MSRIGRAPIPLPDGIKVVLEGQRFAVEGPKGTLSLTLPEPIHVAQVPSGKTLAVTVARDDKSLRAMHGLYRALMANMVHGVTTGFSKELEIVGVGFRAQLQGTQLSLHVGFSHPVVMPIPHGITVEVPKPTSIVIKGADRQLVGQFAANVRRVAPPEPYKGKGIKYLNETIRRKAGKAATGAGGKAAG